MLSIQIMVICNLNWSSSCTHILQVDLLKVRMTTISVHGIQDHMAWYSPPLKMAHLQDCEHLNLAPYHRHHCHNFQRDLKTLLESEMTWLFWTSNPTWGNVQFNSSFAGPLSHWWVSCDGMHGFNSKYGGLLRVFATKYSPTEPSTGGNSVVINTD